MKENIY